jgi:hypothetical protein
MANGGESWLEGEFVYTHAGRQRPVYVQAGCQEVQFALLGGEGNVEVSFDPPELLKRGRGLWEPFAGGSAGVLPGVRALRVTVETLENWAALKVRQRIDSI